MIVGWGVMAALIVIAVLLRIFVIPRLESVPRGVQNALEAVVELAEGYSSSKTVYLGQPMFGYIFTVGAVLIGFAFAELFGFRSPSADITFTLAPVSYTHLSRYVTKAAMYAILVQTV